MAFFILIHFIMNKNLLALAIYFIAILLCIYWYNYKLVILILLFNFAQNIENLTKNK